MLHYQKIYERSVQSTTQLSFSPKVSCGGATCRALAFCLSILVRIFKLNICSIYSRRLSGFFFQGFDASVILLRLVHICYSSKNKHRLSVNIQKIRYGFWDLCSTCLTSIGYQPEMSCLVMLV